MENSSRFKKALISCFSFVVVLSLIFTFAIPTAQAIVIDANSQPGSGGGEYIGSGLALDDTGNECAGYRVSVVNLATGVANVGNSIDLMKNTASFNQSNYGHTPYHASGQKNKLQYIKTYQTASVTMTQSTSGYNTATFSSVGLTWTEPSGMKTYLQSTTTLNKILGKMGFGTVSDLEPGEKLIIEPLWTIRLGNNEWHFLTVTEIGILGRYEYGENTSGYDTGWYNVIDYTNKQYPNALYSNASDDLWEPATAISASYSSPSGYAKFIDLIKKGYGVAVAYNNDFNYKIAFNANGGSGSMDTLTVKFSEKKTLPANTFTRTGYTFKNWNTKADGSGTPYADKATVSGLSQTKNATVKLYAQWTPINVKVTFHKNDGGTATATQTFTYGVSGNRFGYNTDGTPRYEQTGQFGKWDRTGYTLLGWAKSATATSKEHNIYNNVSDTWILGNAPSVDLYGVWDPNKVTIAYNANGGTITSDTYSLSSNVIQKDGAKFTHSAEYGDTINPVNASTFGLKKTGYTFAGWALYGNTSVVLDQNTDYSATKFTQYNDKTKNVSNTTSVSCILVAQWEPNKVTISYNANGGTITSDTYSLSSNVIQKDGAKFTHTGTYGTTINPVNASTFGLTKLGYNFTGWALYGNTSVVLDQNTDYSATKYTHYNDKTKNVSNTASVSSILVSQWDQNNYYVKYNANGGTGTMSNSTHTYNVAKALTANGFTRTGYKFVGWTTKSDGTGTKFIDKQSVTNLTSVNGATVNLYAQWEEITYDVIYSNGSITTGKLETYSIKHTATHTIKAHTDFDLSKTGYHFVGWHVKRKANGGQFIVRDTTDNSTKWMTQADMDAGNEASPGRYTYYKATAGKSVTYHRNCGGELYFYAQWEPNKVTISYNANGGTITTGAYTVSSNVIQKDGARYSHSGKYGTNINPVNASTFGLSKTGYTFAGWALYGNTSVVLDQNTDYAATKYTQYNDKTKNVSNTVSVSSILVAQWSPNTDTPYKVQHWQQKLGGGSTQNSTNFTLKDTENLTGTTGATVKPAIKSYTGFKSPSVQSVTIKADGSTVVNYYYTRNSYVVTLNKSTGISAVSGAGTYKYGATVEIDATVSKGYSWKSWTVNAGGITTPNTKADSFTMPAKAVTLTANATENSHKYIYINGSINTGKLGEEIVKFTETHTVKAHTDFDLSKTGFHFVGWHAKRKNSNDETEIRVTDNTTKKNIWMTETDVVAGNEATPGRYTYIKHTAGKSVVFHQNYDGEICFYAQWEPNRANISYRANGGTVSATDISLDGDIIQKYGTEFVHYVEYGTEKDPTNASTFGLTKTGHNFAGWTLTGNPSVVLDQNTDYDATKYTQWDDKTKNVSNTSQVTCILAAKWEPIKCTIVYDANGGAGTMANQNVTYGSDVAISNNGFTRSGYTFIGWTTNSDGSDDGFGWTGWSGLWTFKNGQNGIVSNKLTLYARWQKNITIEYHANGGTGTMPTQYVTYGERVVIADNAFENGDYDFLGWTTNSDGSNDRFNWTDWSGTWTFKNGERGIADDKLVLYARWSSDQFLEVVPIEPNSNYREGVEVVSAFKVINYSNEINVDKTAPGTAHFTISAPGMTTLTPITVFFVPKGEETTIYYKWRVPAEIEDYSTVTVSVEVKVKDEVRGSSSMNVPSEVIIPSNPPFTKFEDKAPSGFVPNTRAYIPYFANP